MAIKLKMGKEMKSDKLTLEVMAVAEECRWLARLSGRPESLPTGKHLKNMLWGFERARHGGKWDLYPEYIGRESSEQLCKFIRYNAKKAREFSRVDFPRAQRQGCLKPE